MIHFDGKSIHYTGENRDYISFPVGGIGAGMFCVEGNGGLSAFSLRHRPDMQNEPWVFGAVSVKQEGGPQAKLIEGQIPRHKLYSAASRHPYWYTGGLGITTYGLPRFARHEFSASFPFATVSMSDDDMPITANMRAWSPFVPGDADSASLPVGGVEYTLANVTDKDVEGVFYFCARNVFEDKPYEYWKANPQPLFTHRSEKGFTFHRPIDPHGKSNPAWFSVSTDEEAHINTDWFGSGASFDLLTMLWKGIAAGQCPDRVREDGTSLGGSLAVPFALGAGESKVIRITLCWYVPYSDLRHGSDENYDKEDPASYYQPWYAGHFSSVGELDSYWRSCYDELKARSELFNRAFFAMTLPREAVSAVASNLSIFKSTTVMRQKDGRFWAYEGCGDDWGSCHGSCTHVWNYGQALCHLFPKLERSLRETEFMISQNAEGKQNFRSALPIRTPDFEGHAASDGQAGGIIKLSFWISCASAQTALF